MPEPIFYGFSLKKNYTDYKMMTQSAILQIKTK